jgi:HK97 family phage major capsid protein
MPTKREQLEKLIHDTQAFADQLDGSKDAPTADDFAKLDAMVKDVMSLKDAVKADAERAGTLADAKSFLSSLGASADDDDKKDSRPTVTAGGLPAQPNGKTIGEMFVESGQFAEFRKRYGGRDGMIPDSVKGLQSSPFAFDSKALVTGASDTSGGAFVRNDIYAPVTDLIGVRELSVRDLVTAGQTDSDTIEYVRVTSKTNNAAAVPEATSSGQPAAYNAPTAGELTAGGYKPESALALEKVSTTVKTIAHWIPITKRAASDAGQVRTLVDNFLRYGLNEELEDQILTGAGTGENFQGILNAGILTVGSAGTDIDAIVDAIRTVRVTGRRRPTAVVMHPNDWYSTGFLMAKDTTNRYLVGDPRASLDQLNTLWGLRVVVSEAMTENTALVGDFRQAVLWEREGVTLSMSDSHLDFFTRNLLAILAEMRAAFGVLDPQGFCTVTAV